MSGTNTSPIFVGKIRNVHTALEDTAYTVIFSANATEGSRVERLCLTTDDSTQENVVNFYLYDGTNHYGIGQAIVPANAGLASDASIPAVDALAASGMEAITMVDGAGNRFIEVMNGWSIQAKVVNAQNSGDAIFVTCTGGDYILNTDPA